MPKTTPVKGTKLTPVIGKRVAIWYRRVFPTNAVKQVARENGCAIDTAKKWMAGQCPSTEHLLGMWARHGNAFFSFVFEPVDESLARMAMVRHRADRLGAELEALSAELDRLTQED